MLLYTLVYGAMPFDGSNFKRLVKQITTGDYYEPRQPSCKFPISVIKTFKRYYSAKIFFIFSGFHLDPDDVDCEF